jgi:hypothetical protein
MGQVYKCGLFTLASNLSDDDQPWIPPKPPPSGALVWTENSHKAWVVKLLTNSPLASRGWCLQERHLSPRLIHVYHNQVWVWECSTQVRGANSSGAIYSSGLRDHNLSWRKQNLTRDSSLSQYQLLDCWAKLITDYTKRQLTNESDRLAAIPGIERRLQPLLSCVYYAGIWESDYSGLLLYCGSVLRTAIHRFYAPGGIPLERLIGKYHPSDTPTWSWAASDKPVRFLSQYSRHERGEPSDWEATGKVYTELGEISYHSASSNQSNHAGSHIRLRAHLLFGLPNYVSFDNFLRHKHEMGEKAFQVKETSRDEATKLLFVILGVTRRGDSWNYDWDYGFGIILAPSELYKGICTTWYMD